MNNETNGSMKLAAIVFILDIVTLIGAIILLFKL